MKVINLFGGPGVGKTSIMSDIVGILKRKHCNCVGVEEFAKHLVWDGNMKALANQIYIFGNQHYLIDRLKDKVDIVVTDGALFTSIIYGKIYRTISEEDDIAFRNLVYHEFKKYNNINFLIERETVYQQSGRYQDERGAREIDKLIVNCLEEYNVPFKRIGIENAGRKIVDSL
jgi:nicotinamide riboside kinase